MISFFVCLAILIGGYFLYGKYVSTVFAPDDRPTPAVTMADGVDYMVMPTWRIFLIQLLNIAGLGPIWGAIGGALWGPSVFLWITFGTILAGGVHDFASGFMSVRTNGLSVSELTGIYMGNTIKGIMRVFSVVLLFMVGVVFAVGPAGLLAYLCSESGISVLSGKTFWLIIIFAYFFVATFLSVDKVIGKLYPIFGICLIVMAVGIGYGTISKGYTIPEIFPLRNMHPDLTSAWPGMFISVACGAISGFHSTQSPIMARCCKDERMSHMIFYGAMVSEGIIALVWAAAACALFPISSDGRMTGLMEAMAVGQSGCVYNICSTTMGGFGVVLAMLGVIACPISSGDTAFRSARLTLADWFHIDQQDWKKRLLVTLPLLAVGILVSQLDYSTIWSYSASTNQILAMIVLWTAAMYLVRSGKKPYIALFPAMFMSAVTMTFVFRSELYLGRIPGLSQASSLIGIAVTAVFLVLFLHSAKKVQK